MDCTLLKLPEGDLFPKVGGVLLLLLGHKEVDGRKAFLQVLGLLLCYRGRAGHRGGKETAAMKRSRSARWGRSGGPR